jgi:hypothetical protein
MIWPLRQPTGVVGLAAEVAVSRQIGVDQDVSEAALLSDAARTGGADDCRTVTAEAGREPDK